MVCSRNTKNPMPTASVFIFKSVTGGNAPFKSTRQTDLEPCLHNIPPLFPTSRDTFGPSISSLCALNNYAHPRLKKTASNILTLGTW